LRVQLQPDDAIVEVSDEECAAMAESFARSHYVRLPGLIDGELARKLHDRVEAGGFFDRVDPGVARELTAYDAGAIGLLSFMLNDERLRALVGTLVGPTPTVWSGRIYRLAPGGYHDGWHGDVDDERVAALSINLSPEPFEGCALQIRDAHSLELLSEVENTGLGDAVLFRIDLALEHRNTELAGVRPKTACAGFFRVGETFTQLLQRLAHTR
jgi:hypothetical protein